MVILSAICLVPVRRLRPPRSMHFDDVSKTNGYSLDHLTRNASAARNNEAQGLGKCLKGKCI